MSVEVLRVEGAGNADPATPNGNAGALYTKLASGVAELYYKSSDGTVKRLSLPVQSITGATAQLQIDSIVAALVALGLATDNR